MTSHIPVLLHETIDGLEFKDGDIFFDGTLGGGGHSAAAFQTGKKIKILGTDLDEDAITRTKELLESIGADYALSNENFRNLDKVIADAGFSCVHKILLDLGISSFELDESNRGFSFMRDEPLMMTMSKNPEEAAFTAETLVNDWAEESIADIIYGYGEERFARRIAKAIVAAREKKPIKTTFELRDVIASAIPGFARSRKIHPATKTFQAIRIAVNDELGSLKVALPKAFEKLCAGGRLAIISFHSLEDRIVKRFFMELEKSEKGRNIFKKPVVPSDEEIAKNPRSRSAKLRIFEKIKINSSLASKSRDQVR